MFDTKFFDDINARISEVIAASPAKDIEKNMKAMMTSMFTRLDLVTREEFDVQMQVLQRTREKLEALEARLERERAEREAASATAARADAGTTGSTAGAGLEQASKIIDSGLDEPGVSPASA
jgi:BMFP domain-containing protein YqiC